MYVPFWSNTHSRKVQCAEKSGNLSKPFILLQYLVHPPIHQSPIKSNYSRTHELSSEVSLNVPECGISSTLLMSKLIFSRSFCNLGGKSKIGSILGNCNKSRDKFATSSDLNCQKAIHKIVYGCGREAKILPKLWRVNSRLFSLCAFSIFFTKGSEHLFPNNTYPNPSRLIYVLLIVTFLH